MGLRLLHPAFHPQMKKAFEDALEQEEASDEP
jgi:hypothetical protein